MAVHRGIIATHPSVGLFARLHSWPHTWILGGWRRDRLEDAVRRFVAWELDIEPHEVELELTES